MSHESPRHRILRLAGIIGGVAIIVAVLWIDIATGLWQDFVILAGLAAGLVTFLLTVLVIDRVVARSHARRWAPVTRLALTEFLHDLADEDRSEITRGEVIPRALPRLDPALPSSDWPDELHRLRSAVATERRVLTDALSRWAEFLAASADTGEVLRHVADIALQMDRIRDASLELERAPRRAQREALDAEVRACNSRFDALVAELAGQLDTGAAAALPAPVASPAAPFPAPPNARPVDASGERAARSSP